MTRTFVLANSNSFVAANKGVTIVDIHRVTCSGGDTNDTVMRVVVVTIVGSSAISAENVRDFGNSRMSRRRESVSGKRAGDTLYRRCYVAPTRRRQHG